VQFDSYKFKDLFNVSFYKCDLLTMSFIFLKGGSNYWFDQTSRSDQVSNLIDVTIRLNDYGLGADTYYISVTAISETILTVDQFSGRSTLLRTDGEAEASYELRLWGDDQSYIPPNPQVIKVIPDLEVDEDTDMVGYLDLYEHFEDGDVGDGALTFKASVISGRLKELVLRDHELGFLAEKDFHGKVVVKVTAVDRKHLQRTLTWNITFRSVNDPPISIFGTHIHKMWEDNRTLLDLSTLVYDIDKGDRINISVLPREHVHFNIDNGSPLVEVWSDVDWFGSETVIFIATDLAGASTKVPIAFVVEPIDDDPVCLQPIPAQECFEDSNLTLNMSEYFYEPDGQSLAFKLDSPAHLDYEFDWVNGILTLAPNKDWFGFLQVMVTATDTTERSVGQCLPLLVRPVNDLPEILRVHPSLDEVRLSADAYQLFIVLEVDNPEAPVHAFQWYLDDSLVGGGPIFVFSPGPHDSSLHHLKVVAIDEQEGRTEHNWTIRIGEVPRLPVGDIVSPDHGQYYLLGESIEFIASAFHPDGLDLTFEWLVDGLTVGNSSRIKLTPGKGRHNITVIIRSYDAAIQRSIFITVSTRSEFDDWLREGEESEWLQEVPVIIGTAAVMATCVFLGTYIIVKVRRQELIDRRIWESRESAP
jgi:hypothetical protein